MISPIDQDSHFGSRTWLSLSQAATLLISELQPELQPFGAFSPGALFWLAKRQFRSRRKNSNSGSCFFSVILASTSPRGYVPSVLAWRGRTLARERGSGRLNDPPDTKQQTDAAHAAARDAPALILLRNNGAETDGWRGLPFWWPVVVVPRSAVTSILAANAPAAV